MGGYPTVPGDTPFADCVDQSAVIKGPQLAAINWLLRAGVRGVLPKRAYLPCGKLFASGKFLTFAGVSSGARVLVTPKGPTLWVPGSFESPKYRAACAEFLAAYGWSGSLDKNVDIDHVVPRKPYMKSPNAKPTDWFLMMVAPAQQNRSWGAWWEKKTEESGDIGYFGILKALNHPSPTAVDRDEGTFVAYAKEAGALLAKHLDPPAGTLRLQLATINPYNKWPQTAAVRLGHSPSDWGKAVTFEEWLTWWVLSVVMQTLPPF